MKDIFHCLTHCWIHCQHIVNTLLTYRKYIVNIVNTLSERTWIPSKSFSTLLNRSPKHYQSSLHVSSIFILGSKKIDQNLWIIFKNGMTADFLFWQHVFISQSDCLLKEEFPNLDTPNLIFENNFSWSWISRFLFQKNIQIH